MSETSGHAVENGELLRVSPSQLKTWHLCNRRWYFEKVAHIEVPERARYLDVGEDTHRQIEHFLNTGEPVFGAAARLAYDNNLLPAPQLPGQIVEGRLVQPDLRMAGVRVDARLDYFYPTARRILDWKTSKDISKYGLTPDQLRKDEQALIYSRWALDWFKDRVLKPADVSFGHVVMQTKGRGWARKTEVTLSPDEIQDGFEVLEQDVVQMKAHAAISKADDVPVSEERDENGERTCCKAFGGCPFRGICSKAPQAEYADQLVSLFGAEAPSTTGEDKMSVLDELAKIQAQVKSVPDPGPAPTKTEVLPAKVEVLPQEPLPEPPGFKAQVTVPPESDAEVVQGATGVVPPDAAKIPKNVRKPKGYVLYINCLPTKASFNRLDEFVTKCERATEQLNKVPDFRLIEYGKGPGHLANAARLLKDELKGNYVVWTAYGEASQVVAEALAEFADEAVRAR